MFGHQSSFTPTDRPSIASMNQYMMTGEVGYFPTIRLFGAPSAKMPAIWLYVLPLQSADSGALSLSSTSGVSLVDSSVGVLMADTSVAPTTLMARRSMVAVNALHSGSCELRQGTSAMR